MWFGTYPSDGAILWLVKTLDVLKTVFVPLP